jgi:P27 family predicted phage terminase small subunit
LGLALGGKGCGRRPKPIALRKLQGNPGKRPLNRDEPAPAPGEPPMPMGLSAAAQAEWRTIVAELLTLNVLSIVDGKALAAYCHNFSRWMEAEEEITRLGLIVEEPITKGQGEDAIIVGYKYKRNPGVTISNDAQKLMKSFLIEFGLTPASRSRLRIEKKADDDPFAKFLAGKQPQVDPQPSHATQTARPAPSKQVN